DGLIRNKKIDRCLAFNGTSFRFGSCVPTDPEQLWTYNNTTLQHKATKQCLDGVGSGSLFYLRNCDPSDPFQQWTYKKPNFVQNAYGRCLQTDGQKLSFMECDPNDPEMAWETSGTIVT
ncbi:hypothetical protein EBZ38_03000, partial [bacterium]|nr:hypothetical protein [bacterium]